MWGDSKHFHQSTKISILTKNSILALSGVHSEMHGDDMRDENQAISFIDVTLSRQKATSLWHHWQQHKLVKNSNMA